MRSTPCKAGWVTVCADRIRDRRPHALQMMTWLMHARPVLSAGADATSRMLLPSVWRYIPLASASDAAAGSMVKNRCAPDAGLRECISVSSMPTNLASTHSTAALSAATDSWCGRTTAEIPARSCGMSDPNGSAPPRRRVTPEILG